MRIARKSRLARYGLLAVLWAGLFPSPILAADDKASEYALKAAFLYKFGDFVSWPDGVFASPATPIILCIVGRDPFGGLLDEVVKGQAVGSHAIVVRRLQLVQRNDECHILYASGSLAQNPDAALAAVRGTPTLTITDENQNATTHGIIHLVIRDKRVRLEIDQQAAAENNLGVSAKLLSIAISVRPRSGK